MNKEFIDIDYWYKLNSKEKQFLKEFLLEYYFRLGNQHGVGSTDRQNSFRRDVFYKFARDSAPDSSLFQSNPQPSED